MSSLKTFPVVLVAEHYEVGEYVFRQGDLADRICVIIKGRVEIVHTDGTTLHKITELSPGQIFGEMAVLREDQATRLAGACAIEPLDVISVSKQDVKALIDYLPSLGDAFNEIITRRQTHNAGR